MINALKAVNVALSVDDANGRPQARGDGLLTSPTSSAIIDAPNAHERLSFTITNTGSTTQHMVPILQTLGAPIAGRTITLQLDPTTDPTFLNAFGAPRSYIEQTFTVPEGAQHLDAAIAFQSPLTSPATIVYFALLDPSGRQAAYSEPQGFGQG